MPKRVIPKATKKSKLIDLYSRGDISIREAADQVGMAYAYARRIVTKGNSLDIVKEKMEKRAEKLEISQEQVLHEYQLIGFSDIKNYIELDSPLFKDLNELPEGASRAIESIQVDRFTNTNKAGETTVHDRIKFKLWSKPAALEMIARHTGGFVEKKGMELTSATVTTERTPMAKSLKVTSIRSSLLGVSTYTKLPSLIIFCTKR